MFLLRRWQVFLLIAAMMAAPAWAARSHRTPTAHRHHRYHHHYYHHRRRRIRGQRAMAADRVRQIQAALIKKHYLTGEPNGRWDTRTKTAMRNYQADHGWQTKLMPDARAIIRLGLGPKVDEARVQKTNKIKQPQPSIDYADTLAAVQIIRK